jgi:hypothetical protein
MQSEYPILNQHEVVKSVQELWKWVEHSYNIRMTLISYITRLKAGVL